MANTPNVRAVEATVEIEAPVEAVWKALTDAEELTNWFPLQATVEPGEGGKIWYAWRDYHQSAARISIWEPESRLRVVYSSEVQEEQQGEAGLESELENPVDFDPANELAVEYVLEEAAGATRLKVIHSGFGQGSQWDEWHDGVRRGWRFELSGLRHYLERHRGRSRATAWARKVADLSESETWERLMSASGLLREGNLQGLNDGDSYSLVTASGDRFEGVVNVLEPPQDFAGTVENLDAAFFRIKLDSFQGPTEVHLFLSAYGWSEEQVKELESRWTRLLEDLYG